VADNVVFLNTDSTLGIPVERVLEGAQKADLDLVMVAGRYEDGRFYLACSSTDIPLMVTLLELAKRRLLREIED